MKRKIIRIDEERCNGCGLCVPACHEGALQIVDGKARLVKDAYCDGLGDCLGECPQDAIAIEEREAEPYDEEAVQARLAASADAVPKAAGGCPGMKALNLAGTRKAPEEKGLDSGTKHPSELRQWPVQLHLVPVHAPYWQEAQLLLCADCVPFAYADFHRDLLKGKQVINACPKLDDTSNYVDKLADILGENDIESLTVAHMEVPCCSGLVQIARQALQKSGRDVPLELVQVGVRGDL